MGSQKINCPLMGKDIEDTVCFDTHMVSEGLAPESTAPEEVTAVPDYKKICLNCKNHKE